MLWVTNQVVSCESRGIAADQVQAYSRHAASRLAPTSHGAPTASRRIPLMHAKLEMQKHLQDQAVVTVMSI
jgi:hypothetical protein